MLEKYHLSNQTISDVCKIVGILRNANYAKENSGGGLLCYKNLLSGAYQIAQTTNCIPIKESPRK